MHIFLVPCLLFVVTVNASENNHVAATAAALHRLQNSNGVHNPRSASIPVPARATRSGHFDQPQELEDSSVSRISNDMNQLLLSRSLPSQSVSVSDIGQTTANNTPSVSPRASSVSVHGPRSDSFNLYFDFPGGRVVDSRY